jgi:hypothetical protein
MMQGYYRPTCDGTEQQDPQCIPCTVGGCGNNQYRPVCEALFSYSDSVCLNCSTAQCPIAGQVRPICDGAVATKDSQCTLCRTGRCSAGEYIQSRCAPEGSTAFSGFICKQCTKSCKAGQYLSGVCDGLGYSDVSCFSCKASCERGEFISTQCNGASTQVIFIQLWACLAAWFNVNDPPHYCLLCMCRRTPPNVQGADRPARLASTSPDPVTQAT